MKSKQGALFHWITAGVLLAIGLFMLFNYDPDIRTKIKGEWQLEFLQNYYVPAEEKLLQIEQTALEAGTETILALAKNGGFAADSECGSSNGVHYWNTEETFCFLKITEEVNGAFNAIFIKEYGGDEPYTISYQGQELVGGAVTEIVISDGANSYTVAPHFRANLNYRFDEYFQLQNEAAGLVNVCKWKGDLKGCLQEHKPEHWKFSDCDNPAFKEDGRKVTFCVESPGKYSVFKEGKEINIQYKLGLDFIPSPAEFMAPGSGNS